MGPSWQANAETAPVLPLRAYFAILTQARQNSAVLFWTIFFKKHRFLRRMELSNKFLSPTYAPDLGDIATYFFFRKKNRSDGEICVSVTQPPNGPKSKMASLKHIFLHRIEVFFRKKKYGAISPGAGAHVGERIFLLSAIPWSYRQNTAILSGIVFLVPFGVTSPKHIFWYRIEIFFQKKVCVDISKCRRTCW